MKTIYSYITKYVGACVCVCVYIYIYMYACVCVCLENDVINVLRENVREGEGESLCMLYIYIYICIHTYLKVYYVCLVSGMCEGSPVQRCNSRCHSCRVDSAMRRSLAAQTGLRISKDVYTDQDTFSFYVRVPRRTQHFCGPLFSHYLRRWLKFA